MNKLTKYRTFGGVLVTRRSESINGPKTALNEVLSKIDSHKGAIFASGYEYPGRYSRWDIGFVDPPIEFVSCGRKFQINALNEKGVCLLEVFNNALLSHSCIDGVVTKTKYALSGRVISTSSNFSEEERLRQPTIFSILRTLVGVFKSAEDSHLGFYGALGYDLVFQVEPIDLRHIRSESRPDLHLFLPDELVVTDHRLEQSHRYTYDFSFNGKSTEGLSRAGTVVQFERGVPSSKVSDHAPGEYVEKVREIITGARKGDFFEVVLSQKLSAGYGGTPRQLFELIRTMNPSPYEFLINLGSEQLIGASPEMFVEVDGSLVHTCPISGTIKRGRTPLEDAENILKLLNSIKDKSELNMCTDVDRNDKARVCKAGSIVLRDRRLIEKYSRLIHTVDHVVGELSSDKDGFDALLAHMWAGTLTGAPKHVAMQRIEDLENSARGWYGGCIGMLLFNGSVKTGITIRTVHLEKGMASVRAGSTLLAHSDPESEERESQLKASAFMDAVLGKVTSPVSMASSSIRTGEGKRVLLVDNCDSFVHTLGDYVRQTGAEVVTHRAGKNSISFELLDVLKPDLVVISPGPGRPDDFNVQGLVHACVDRKIPMFGVCLGLQGIVEAFCGTLVLLDDPMHGMESSVYSTPEGLSSGIIPDKEFVAGRYHSIYAKEDDLPECLEVLAYSDDGIIMSVMHKELPIAAVQFHPESLMTMGGDNIGLRLIAQSVKVLTSK